MWKIWMPNFSPLAPLVWEEYEATCTHDVTPDPYIKFKLLPPSLCSLRSDNKYICPASNLAWALLSSSILVFNNNKICLDLLAICQTIWALCVRYFIDCKVEEVNSLPWVTHCDFGVVWWKKPWHARKSKIIFVLKKIPISIINVLFLVNND